jgi:hypothetical protein
MSTLDEEHEHEWTESLEGDTVVGKHCIICGIDYDYSADYPELQDDA